MFFPQPRRYRQFGLWPTSIFCIALLCWYFGVGRRLRVSLAYQRTTLAAARALQSVSCQRDLEAQRAYGASHKTSACALDNVPAVVRAGLPGRAVGPLLQVFFRVSAAEKSWSGARRFLGWDKPQTALTTAYSLRVALDHLEGALAPPRAVNITILYDGLQDDRLRQKSWIAAMNAIFLSGRRSSGSGGGGGAATAPACPCTM